MISPESIQEAAADAVAPSQFLARLAGILAAHGENVERLLDLTTQAAIGEADRITLNQFFGGDNHAA